MTHHPRRRYGHPLIRYTNDAGVPYGPLADDAIVGITDPAVEVPAVAAMFATDPAKPTPWSEPPLDAASLLKIMRDLERTVLVSPEDRAHLDPDTLPGVNLVESALIPQGTAYLVKLGDPLEHTLDVDVTTDTYRVTMPVEADLARPIPIVTLRAL